MNSPRTNFKLGEKYFSYHLPYLSLVLAEQKKLVEAKPVSPAIIQKKLIMNELDSISYAFGLNVGQTFKQIQEDSDGKYSLNIEQFSQAIQDLLKGSPKISGEEQKAILESFGQKMQELAMEKQKLEGSKMKEVGTQFLAANAKEEGVQTTASGLQYKVIKEGDGMSPKATDKVRVHYVGTMLDGSTFDSSRDRGEPISFPLNGVIAGWTEGLQLMKVGATYEFFIPSDLAYGDQGNQGIPGGSVLKFEVELLGIE